MRFLVSIAFLFSFCSLQGQTAFYKLYSGNGYDRGEGIAQVADSGYVVTGSSSSWGGNTDAYLLKVDKDGNYQWSNHYGGTESECARRVLYQPGSGFYLAGFSNSFSNGNFDAYLVKTDLSGNKLWEKTYGTTNWERINDAVLTADSCIIMVGESQPLNGDLTDMFLVKVNHNGDTLWTKTMGGIGEDAAKSIVRMDSNTFLVSGSRYVEDSLMSKGIIFKIDSAGNVIWSKVYGDYSGSYSVNDISLGTDSIVYFVGDRFVSEFNHDDYFGKCTKDGVIINQITSIDPDLSSPANCIFDEVIALSESGKIGIGLRNKYGNLPADFPFDVALYLLDNVSLSWINESAFLYNENEDWIGQLERTNDHSTVLVGTHSSTGDANNTENGGSHIFVLKLGENQVFPTIGTDFTLNPLTKVEQVEGTQSIQITPNPFTENIQIQSQQNFEFEMVNLSGALQFSGNSHSINLEQFTSLPQGIYFMHIKDSATVVKLIKH